MGCDGGTIPTRDELVKLKKKPEQKDVDSIRLYKWAHCALSQQVLHKKGIVACEMGRLYNKEAVIELLLSKDRSGAPAYTTHIEKLKDVVELDLTLNPAYDSRRQDAVGDGMYEDKLVSMFMCPVTGLEMNGRFRFVFCFSTGKVISERAVKVLQKDLNEAGRYKEDDLVLLNPSDEEIDDQTRRMAERRARVKAEKKAAKAAKKNSDAGKFKLPEISSAINSDQSLTDEPLAKYGAEESSASGETTFKDQGKGKKSKRALEESEDGSNKKVFNPFAALARKEKEQDALPVREGPKVKKADCKADLKSVNTSSVQQSGKSEVFKKLFTSHKSAQNLPKGNWVTFDPRYN